MGHISKSLCGGTFPTCPGCGHVGNVSPRLQRFSFGALLLLGWGLAPAHAGEPSLQDAQKRLWHGNYAEARGLFEAVAKQPQHKVAAAIGVSRTWQSQGDYDKAEGVLELALKELPASADLLAHRADLLYLLGKWEDSEKSAKEALSQHQDQFLAHWTLARLHQGRGDFKRAGEELVWFVRTFAKRDGNLNDPEQVLLVCRPSWNGPAGTNG